MSALVAGVFAASVLGSLHCAGMCGPFVTVIAGQGAARPRVAAYVAYNGGRLAAYVALGAVAGGLGAFIDLTARATGIQRVAALLAGALIVVWGVATLLAVLGHVRLPRASSPAIARVLGRIVARTRAWPAPALAGALGLASALLPCGWLWAFVVTAAGTGDAVTGALVMTAFWLGTVPAMVGLGLGMEMLAVPLRRHVPAACAVVTIVIGLVAIGTRSFR